MMVLIKILTPIYFYEHRFAFYSALNLFIARRENYLIP